MNSSSCTAIIFTLRNASGCRTNSVSSDFSQQLPIVHSVAGLNSNRFICLFGARRCEKHALSHFLNEIACKSISWFPCSLHRHRACNWQLSEHWAGEQSWEEVLMGGRSPMARRILAWVSLLGFKIGFSVRAELSPQWSGLENYDYRGTFCCPQ